MSGETGGQWAALLDEAAEALERMGERGWLVGGCLRDALLGVPVRDVDLAVTCEPMELARAVKQGRAALTIAALNRETVRLGLRGDDGKPALQLDVAPLHGGGIEADLALRDFRVNAMALPLEARREFVALLARAGAPPASIEPPRSLLDPLGGLGDVCSRTITPASGHALSDDPGRIIRAGRLAARLGFEASGELLDAARAAAPGLLGLTGDRLREELHALLALPRAADGLGLMADVSALTRLFPNLGRDGALAHALASVRAVAGLQDGGEAFPGMEALESLEPLRAWYAAALPDGLPQVVALRWGLLAHAAISHATPEDESVGDAEARASRVAEQLSLAGAERRIVAEVIRAGRWQEMLAERRLDETELRHWFAAAGDAAVDVIVAAAACNAALAVAPVEGQRFAAAVGERARTVLDVYFTDRERLVPPRLLSGGDLLRELGMAPGPEIGRVLRVVRSAQLDGKVRTRAEALEWARGHEQRDSTS